MNGCRHAVHAFGWILRGSADAPPRFAQIAASEPHKALVGTAAELVLAGVSFDAEGRGCERPVEARVKIRIAFARDLSFGTKITCE
jgi:hypothetical protein